MPRLVTLAVIGGHDGVFDAPFPNQDYDRPYARRQKIEVEVADGETLKSVFHRALEELGVSVTYGDSPADTLAFGAFYKPEDDGGLDKRRFLHLHDLTTVDEEGRAVWGRQYADVTYSELNRTAEAGVLEGDPTRPYLILQSPAGNGVLATWAFLMVGWQILRTVLASASDVEGALQLKERLESRCDRVDRGYQALSDHYLEWGEKGARPDNFSDMLYRSDTWSSADLASLLDCPPVSASAILEAFGFAPAESGLWRLKGDEDATFLEGATEEVFIAAGMPGTPEVEVKKRLEQFVRTGERPPLFSEEELGEEVAPEELEDLDLDKGEARAEIPLPIVRFDCSCGRDDCTATARFSVEGRNSVLSFENVVDHFMVPAATLPEVADQLMFEAYDA